MKEETNIREANLKQMPNGRFHSDSIYGTFDSISSELGRKVVPIENWNFWTKSVQ